MSRTDDSAPKATKLIGAISIVTLVTRVAACGGGGASAPDGAIDGDASVCPVPAEARLLLSSLAIGALVDAEHSGGGSMNGGWHLGLSLSIAGAAGPVDFILAEACTGPRGAGAHTCGSDDLGSSDGFWTTHEHCFTLGCEAAGVHLMTAYLAMTPIVDPANRHVFTYDMAAPFRGSVQYDPNPLVRWRVDVTDPAHVTGSATLDQHLEVTPSVGAALDFSYEGTATTTSQAGDTHAVVELRFPQLAATGPQLGPIIVHIQSGASGPEGTIKLGSHTLATFSNASPPVTWVASCPLTVP